MSTNTVMIRFRKPMDKLQLAAFVQQVAEWDKEAVVTPVPGGPRFEQGIQNLLASLRAVQQKPLGE